MLILIQVRALSVSLGYFIYDTVCCLLIENDPANTIHHICTIVAVAIGVLHGTVRNVCTLRYALFCTTLTMPARLRLESSS